MARVADRKVLMVGIDASDIGLIRSSLHELPRLRQLLTDGVVHELPDAARHLTSAVWPTFSTGTPPGEHGIYYPMQWDAAAMQLRRVTADWVRCEPFWYDLARQGIAVTVLDVPFSLPSRLERGVEVQNWGSQECLGPFQSNDRQLAREVRRRFGAHPMGQDVPVQQTPAKLEQSRRNLIAGARRKGELARWLMQTTDWDLFVTVFGECHRGGHVLWPDLGELSAGVPAGALLDVYRAVDDALGHVLDGVDRSSTTVIVFSVHGMTANYTQEHFVPGIVERINARFAGEKIAEPKAEPDRLRRNPMRMLREALPPQLQATVARALPTAVRDWVVRRAFCGGLDWRRSPGFALPGSGESYLRYNLCGREAAGSLERDSDAHRRYARLLRDELLGLRDAATGTRVVREVVSTAEPYPGARGALLPDLVILWNDVLPSQHLSSDTLGHLRGALGTGRTGDHRPGGFAVVDGDRDGLDRAPPLAHISDFARFARSLLLPGAAG